jgi:hypothetical protein
MKRIIKDKGMGVCHTHLLTINVAFVIHMLSNIIFHND